MSKKLAITKPAMPSSLTLPPTAPPPRKEDIINAMVERARVKHAEESAKLNEKREAAKKALHDAIAAELERILSHSSVAFAATPSGSRLNIIVASSLRTSKNSKMRSTPCLILACLTPPMSAAKSGGSIPTSVLENA